MGPISHGPSPRNVEAIVDQQLAAWRAENRSEKTRREAAPRLVTVSREFGAGGARISKLVADGLGFTLWDHAFVKHVAEGAGAHPRLVEAIDEHKRDLLDDVMSSSFLRMSISGAIYRRILTHTVSELATHGASVIVGRGANFLVRPEQALRVRVICPLKERVRRHAEREKLSMAEAERIVTQTDAERTRFVRQLCGEDPREPLHYDLIVNTAELSEEQAARLVVDAYEARFGNAEQAVPSEHMKPQPVWAANP